MERRPWLVSLALGLSLLPAVAAAASGPEVPYEALADVPQGVREAWDRRAERIDQMSREIEAARSSSALGEAVDEVEAARRDLRATLTEASNLRIVARSRLQVVQLTGVDAEIGLDTAKLERRLARSDLRAARHGGGRAEVRETRERLADARDRHDAAKEQLGEVSEGAARNERTAAADQLAVADQAMATARQALNEVGAISTGVGRQRITRAEIELLEARRDLAVAELEHDRAIGAYTSGSRLRLRPYLDAVEEARAAESAARQALTPTATVGVRRR